MGTPDPPTDSHATSGSRRAKMALVRASAALALALATVVAIGMWSGWYDVSAKSGHSGLVAGALSATMVRSVRAHARGVAAPTSIDFRSPTVLEKGAAHFEKMCRMCHGAPGRPAADWELYPPAPDLVDALRKQQWSDPELFWIIKHGIKDTGMPGFGVSHDDDSTWAMTAFVRHLPKVTPEQYQAMSRRGLERGQAAGEAGYHSPASSPRETPPSSGHQPPEHKHE